MTRKKNIYFGFGPASKKERKKALTLYRKPKGKMGRVSQASGDPLRADVAAALVNQGYDKATAKKAAASARGADFSSLFRDAIKRNPRTFPAVTDSQLQALRKLVTTTMPKKRRTKKKNSRKGKMPAGLKAYWAKKRRAKAKRKNPRKRRKPVARRRRKVSVRVRNYRRTRRASKPRRRRRARRSNPLRAAKRITLKGFTAAQIRTVAGVVRRATGKRVRVVKP
jgi:hypothetical protein